MKRSCWDGSPSQQYGMMLAGLQNKYITNMKQNDALVRVSS